MTLGPAAEGRRQTNTASSSLGLTLAEFGHLRDMQVSCKRQRRASCARLLTPLLHIDAGHAASSASSAAQSGSAQSSLCLQPGAVPSVASCVTIVNEEQRSLVTGQDGSLTTSPVSSRPNYTLRTVQWNFYRLSRAWLSLARCP